MQNWDKKWKKKKLRVRNPLTCQVRARAGTPLLHFEQKTGRKRTCALEGRAGCTAAPPLPNLPDFFPPHAQIITVTIYDTCGASICSAWRVPVYKAGAAKSWGIAGATHRVARTRAGPLQLPTRPACPPPPPAPLHPPPPHLPPPQLPRR